METEMTQTLYVLLAAGALGAPGDAVCPCNAAAPSGGPYAQATPPGGGVLGWVRNLFGPRHATVTYQTMPAAQAVRPQPAPAVQPAAYAVRPAPAVIASPRTSQPVAPAAPSAAVIPQVTTVTTQQPNFEAPNLTVAKKYEDRVGHERDYSWVTGHLFYIHADGGRWVVRYALPDEVDKFGGSIVLAPGVEMRNYREGDLVCVHGDVLDEGRTSRSLGGPLYRVNVISLVDRADP
jgi:hypothetical protein